MKKTTLIRGQQVFEQFNSGKESKVSEGSLHVTSLVNSRSYGNLTAGKKYQVKRFTADGLVIVVNDDLGKEFFFLDGSKRFENYESNNQSK
jgi:hypothetical protein